jgi:hypothetical protein
MIYENTTCKYTQESKRCCYAHSPYIFYLTLSITFKLSYCSVSQYCRLYRVLYLIYGIWLTACGLGWYDRAMGVGRVVSYPSCAFYHDTQLVDEFVTVSEPQSCTKKLYHIKCIYVLYDATFINVYTRLILFNASLYVRLQVLSARFRDHKLV